MRDLAEIAELSDRDLGLFQTLVRRFLSGRAFRRKQKSATDDDWRFVLRHRALLGAYFETAGWEFEIREDLGAAVARPTHRRHTQIFSVAQSHLVYHMLLLHYDATSGDEFDVTDVRVTFGDLVERVESTLPAGEKLRHASLEKACRKLRDFGAISLPAGFEGATTEEIVVHPVIEMVIPLEVVRRQIDALEDSRAVQGEPDEPIEDAVEEVHAD